MSTISLAYPVGIFEATSEPDPSTIEGWKQTIANFPAQMRQAVESLAEEELSYRYRPGGWTIRQVVHHCADSHLNAYTRFKLALTEDNPGIKPYNETAWAELPDYEMPLAASLQILDGLHQRWEAMLRQMQPADFDRTFFHPEHGTVFSLTLALDNYDWHCRHHLAHVHQARKEQFTD